MVYMVSREMTEPTTTAKPENDLEYGEGIVGQIMNAIKPIDYSSTWIESHDVVHTTNMIGASIKGLFLISPSIGIFPDPFGRSAIISLQDIRLKNYSNYEDVAT